MVTINYKLSQNNTEYSCKLNDGFVQIVRLDTRLDVPEENIDMQKSDGNQATGHHQDQSRSEFWNRKSHRIAIASFIFVVLAVIISILIFLFGDGILRRI